MKRITFHREAEDDLRDSEVFYERQGGHDLAFDFSERLHAALRLVAQDPGRFARVRKFPMVQKCRVTRFPFSLYYVERPADLWVIAVAHGSRKPDYWAQRLKQP